MSSCSSCQPPASQQYLLQIQKETTDPLKNISKPETNIPKDAAKAQGTSALNTTGSLGRSLNVTA